MIDYRFMLVSGALIIVCAVIITRWLLSSKKSEAEEVSEDVEELEEE